MDAGRPPPTRPIYGSARGQEAAGSNPHERKRATRLARNAHWRILKRTSGNCKRISRLSMGGEELSSVGSRHPDIHGSAGILSRHSRFLISVTYCQKLTIFHIAGVDRPHLTTDDGQIEVEALAGSRLASEWELHTGDGSITIRLRRDSQSCRPASCASAHLAGGFRSEDR